MEKNTNYKTRLKSITTFFLLMLLLINRKTLGKTQRHFLPKKASKSLYFHHSFLEKIINAKVIMKLVYIVK